MFTIKCGAICLVIDRSKSSCLEVKCRANSRVGNVFRSSVPIQCSDPVKDSEVAVYVFISIWIVKRYS